MVMKSDMGRLCDIKSLRELRSLQRENEAAKTAAAGRVKSVSLKVISFSEVALLLVKRCVPADAMGFVETILGIHKQ